LLAIKVHILWVLANIFTKMQQPIAEGCGSLQTKQPEPQGPAALQ
jgi:hypothetical protein